MSASSEVTVGEAVVMQLRNWAVAHVFAVPGSSYLPILDALSRQNDIQLFLVRHEETAALMASAYAKLTGDLGVCMAHSGPGAVRLLNGLYDAKHDRAAVLALTGQVPTDKMGTGAKQTADQDLLFLDCTVYNRTVIDPKDALELLIQGMREAVAQEQVAHLAFAENVLTERLKPSYHPPESHLRTPPALDLAAVGEMLPFLSKAKKPVIMAGRGCLKTGPSVTALADRLGAAVIVTLPAKGIVPEDHPLVVGVLGEAGSTLAKEVAREADLFLVLGATWWPSDFLPQQATVLQVDVRATGLGEDHPLTLGIAARLEDVLPELLRRLPEKPQHDFGKEIATRKAQALRAQPPRHGKHGLHPVQVVRSLHEAVPDDATLCIDTGAHTLWFGSHYLARRETVLVSGKWRTMGFALPAAMAAKIARPNKAAVALIGDGGFAMVMEEFSTAVRYRLPLTVLVMNNGMLAEEAYRQQQSGYPVYGMSLYNPDFAAFARTCGGYGLRVDRQDTLEQAIRESLTRTVPTLIDVVVDPESAPPLLTPLEGSPAAQKQKHAVH